MSALTCLARAQALAALCALAALAASAPPDPATGLSTTVAALDGWLDENSTTPPREANPAIAFLDPEAARGLSGRSAHEGTRIRGLYDPAADTIYLVRPWSAGNLQNLGTLLHELAHRRQAAVPGWPCAGAEEASAYRLQEAWLRQHGAASRTDWFAVTLAGNCTPRDVHP